MQQCRISAQAEILLNSMRDVRESAQVVYEITQHMLDAFPEGMSNPMAEALLNQAHDELQKSDNLLAMGRGMLRLGVYPHYPASEEYFRRMEEKSDGQKERLDHHLRYVCLRDSGSLLGRYNAALAAIDGLLRVYECRDAIFYLLDRPRVASSERRLGDGIVDLSIEFVESIAGVLRQCTRIAP